MVRKDRKRHEICRFFLFSCRLFILCGDVCGVSMFLGKNKETLPVKELRGFFQDCQGVEQGLLTERSSLYVLKFRSLLPFHQLPLPKDL